MPNMASSLTAFISISYATIADPAARLTILISSRFMGLKSHIPDGITAAESVKLSKCPSTRQSDTSLNSGVE